MTKKPGTFSRRKFIKTSAATWGITAFAPYANSLAATPKSHSLASEFMSPPVSLQVRLFGGMTWQGAESRTHQRFRVPSTGLAS